MHLYQRAYRSTNGEKRRAKTWWLVAHVGGERLHVTTGSRDRRAAELIAADIVRKAELKRAGIVDPFEGHTARGLDQHLADFLTTLRARNVVQKYAEEREGCIQAFLAHSGARRLKDLTLVAASAWIEEVKARGLSARSVNSRVRALKQWGRWLQTTRRVQFDPFDGLRQLNEASDRRHVRRALTPAEAQRLLDAARTRPLREAEASRIHAGVTDSERARLTRLGEARALVWLLAVSTGLRMGEIRRLRYCDVEHGRVSIPAASAKSRRDQSVPLPQRVAEAIARYRPKDATPTDTLVPPGAFPNTTTFHRDRAAAGIERRDAEDRVVDAHALRTTYISWLSATGASPRVTQALARHASGTTTERYLDLRLLDFDAAVERLPLPDGPAARRPATEAPTWDRTGRARGA
jgi:integrase